MRKGGRHNALFGYVPICSGLTLRSLTDFFIFFFSLEFSLVVKLDFFPVKVNE